MKHFTTTMLACGIMLAALPTARAADTTCPPSPSFGSTVNGNLIVPAGQICIVFGGPTVTGNVQVQSNATLSFTPEPSTIIGNVSVGTGARLDATAGGLTIDGNLGANQCNFVALGLGSTVGGNVQIQYCTDGGSVVGSDIGGNVGCNNSGTCDVGPNKINGNVEINDNSSAQVSGNTIGNNLGCQGNASISGSGNSVGGHKSGQCANF